MQLLPLSYVLTQQSELQQTGHHAAQEGIVARQLLVWVCDHWLPLFCYCSAATCDCWANSAGPFADNTPPRVVCCAIHQPYSGALQAHSRVCNLVYTYMLCCGHDIPRRRAELQICKLEVLGVNTCFHLAKGTYVGN